MRESILINYARRVQGIHATTRRVNDCELTRSGACRVRTALGPAEAPGLGNEDGVRSDERVVAPTSRRYTQAQKEQAVRLVRQIREGDG